jgi:hypothetical protein
MPELMDYANNSIAIGTLRREFSKAKLTPRSESGKYLPIDEVNPEGLESSNALDESQKISINKKGLSQL